MKKCCVILAMLVLFTGCGRQETYETIADEPVQPVMAAPKEISVRLPDSAAAPVLAGDWEQVYLGEDYEIILETLSSGDLNATVQAISGYEKDRLTILETRQDSLARHEFVWVAAGEDGDRLGRAVILDDGAYHYCMSVIQDAPGDGQEVWNQVFGSFALI